MRLALLRPALLGLVTLLAAGCTDRPATDVAPVAASDTVAPAPAVADDSVLGVASASADLSTFVALARTAGLDRVLADTARTITVFAPSNAAFEALGADALAALRADPAALRARLEAHLLSYRLLSTEGDPEIGVETLGGTEMTFAPGPPLTVRSGGASARVVTPDLDASNGVVHVVDAVLGG